MSHSSSLDSLKMRAKLLQKAKKKTGIEFPLKDAFALIAKSSGFESWKELKDSYEISDLINPPHWSAQWKSWFSTREEALIHFKDGQDFLLPYRKQFFICDMNYIRALGLSENDEDLKDVGHDWSHPNNPNAWKRLLKKMKGSITVGSP